MDSNEVVFTSKRSGVRETGSTWQLKQIKLNYLETHYNAKNFRCCNDSLLSFGLKMSFSGARLTRFSGS